MAAEIAAERLARAATDHDNLSFREVRLLDEFFGDVLRVVTDLFDNRLVVYLVRNASQLSTAYRLLSTVYCGEAAYSKRMNPLSQDARTISLGLEPWWTATEVVFDSDAICNSVHLVKLF